jgi:hypothetical protein
MPVDLGLLLKVHPPQKSIKDCRAITLGPSSDGTKVASNQISASNITILTRFASVEK